MNEGNRIKEVRNYFKLTLEEFGKKLGVTKVAISNIEKGNRNVTEQMRKAICREYNVNYDWLISGGGDMLSDLPQTILDELCKQYECDSLDRSLIEEYLKLDAGSRQILKDYIRNVFKPIAEAESVEDKINVEVEAYRHELELEASQEERSSVSEESEDAKMA